MVSSEEETIARIKAAFKFLFFQLPYVQSESGEFCIPASRWRRFDNIGYARWVYAMLHDAFPFDLAKAKKEGRLLDNGTQPLLNMSKVKFWIELGQLAPVGAGSGLYIHSTGQQSTVDEVLLDNFS